MSDCGYDGRVRINKSLYLSKYKKRKWREKSTSISSETSNSLTEDVYQYNSDYSIWSLHDDTSCNKAKFDKFDHGTSSPYSRSPLETSRSVFESSVEDTISNASSISIHPDLCGAKTGVTNDETLSTISTNDSESELSHNGGSGADNICHDGCTPVAFIQLPIFTNSTAGSIKSSSESEHSNYDYSNADGLINRLEGTMDFNKLFNTLKQDEYNDVIDVPAVVSRADVLLAVVKSALVRNSSHSELADDFKMLNNFFGESLFPDTRYLADELLNSDSFVEFHALCPTCKKYVKKFDRSEREAHCTLCNKSFSLKSATYTDFFVIFDVENEIRDLLESNSEYFEAIRESRTQERETIDDFTHGLLYKKFREGLPDNKKNNFATLTINSDGSPVFNSSKLSVWPIQAVVNELPFEVRIKEVIVCGFWFSKSKPDFNIYLTPFVEMIKKMSRLGIPCTIDNSIITIYVYVLCCCVDSGARPAMQGLVQYNGYYGCNWCLHEGVYIETETGVCVKFPLTDELPEKRNEAQMLEDMISSINSRVPIRGVKRPSALINMPGFNIVSSFVSDHVHCINLGISPQFFALWETSGQPYSLSKADMEYIDFMISNMKVPNHVERLTRSVSDRSFWKSIEYENWTLYYSVPILLSIPHMVEYAKHWMLLVEAYFILLKRNIVRSELDAAHNLLKRFVADTQRLYLQSAMTFNVHQMLHLTQSVVDWGPLYAHSGYCFEDGNGKIVKMIHSAKGVVLQICRTIAMKQSFAILDKHAKVHSRSRVSSFVEYLEQKNAKNSVKIRDARYFGQSDDVDDRWRNELQLSEDAEVYCKMVKHRCLFSSSERESLRSDNSFAVTADGKFIRILFFIVDTDSNKEYTICHAIETQAITSGGISHTREILDISTVEGAIDTNRIVSTCVMTDVDNVKYISTLPNLYYS